MGAINAREARISDWGSRSIGTIWRAFDLQIATYAVLLTSFGLAMAYSNSVAGGDGALETGSVFLRGLLWASMALVVFIVATAFDYRWLRTLAWPLYALQIGLLAVTLAIGSGVGGSSRWISLLGLQFQFSELAKILMIVILANYLASRRGRMDSLWSILGACVLAGPPWALVLLQPDLGTSLVFGAILVGMLFLGGASLRWLGAMALAVLSALPFVWTYVLRDYQKERLSSFIDPLSDIRGAGYQLYQSQIAVGSGGWFGKGLTNSTQNQLDFLPVQVTDFVFAILAEELGFIGGMVVIGLFIALIWRVMAGGWRSRDPFGTMFAAGLASMIAFQVFVNIGMVIGIMPITGIPLPFITHGGASLISIAAGLGILQSINIRQGRAEW
ncbi:MAG: rod shape-determining protein RodA [Chloroflexota bacterium]